MWEYIAKHSPKLVLAVGTKKGAVVWQDEYEKLAPHTQDVRIWNILDGVIKDRVHEIQSKVRAYAKEGRTLVFTVNYEAFSKKYMAESLSNIPFDVIVFDEVHKLRNHTTHISKYAYALARKLPDAYRIGLTGTLLYNRPIDAFGIFRFIDPSVFGTNWNAFRFHYALWAGQFNLFPVKFVNQDELRAKIEANSFYVDRRQVLDLPAEQHIRRYARFALSAQKQYDKLNKEFVTELGDTKVIATNVLDKVNKLQQMTGGQTYVNGISQPFSDAKKDLLDEVLEETTGNTVVVFYKYKSELTTLTSLRDERPVFKINGELNEYQEWKVFNDPSILAVQIKSGAESLDFSKAGITIFYSLLSTYGLYEQALGRTNRGDAKAIYNREHVLYYYLIIQDTIDEKIMEALEDHKDLLDKLLGEKSAKY